MITIDADKALPHAKRAKLAEINRACDAEIGAIKASYPDTEVLSWDKQEREAYALRQDSGAFTPLLDGIAAARGVSRSTLADLVAAKVEQFAATTGPIFGKRQVLEKAIEDATTLEQVQSITWEAT